MASVSAARLTWRYSLFSIFCSSRLPSGAVEEAQVPSVNSARLKPSAHRCSCSRNRGTRTVRARSATDYRLSTICAAPRQSFLYPYDYYAGLEPYCNNERNAIGCRNYNQADPQTQLFERTG